MKDYNREVLKLWEVTEKERIEITAVLKRHIDGFLRDFLETPSAVNFVKLQTTMFAYQHIRCGVKVTSV